MANKLTKKQKEFVEAYVVTGNGTQAALTAYDTQDPDTAGVIAYENLRKPKIQNALEEALPDELLAKIHLEGLFATRSVFDVKGELVAEDADFSVRHKYLDSAYKLKGKYAAEKHLNVNVDIEDSPRIRELAAKLRNLDTIEPYEESLLSKREPSQ